MTQIIPAGALLTLEMMEPSPKPGDNRPRNTYALKVRVLRDFSKEEAMEQFMIERESHPNGSEAEAFLKWFLSSDYVEPLGSIN